MSKSSKAVMSKECEFYMERISTLLQHKSLPSYLPFAALEECSPDEKISLFLDRLRDGILIAHLINVLIPNSIDISKMNKGIDFSTAKKAGSKTLFLAGENANMVLEGLKKLKGLGIILVNFGATDIMEKNPDIVFGLLWQLIRAEALLSVNIVARPELILLLNEGENLKIMADMNPQNILLRWVNHHIGKSNNYVTNFGTDLLEMDRFVLLLSKIIPGASEYFDSAVKKSMDNIEKAEIIETFLKSLSVQVYQIPASLLFSGNARFNLTFISSLFNHFLGLSLPNEQDFRNLKKELSTEQQNVYQMGVTIDEQKNKIMLLQRECDLLKNAHVEKTTREWQSSIKEMNDLKCTIKDLDVKKKEYQSLVYQQEEECAKIEMQQRELEARLSLEKRNNEITLRRKDLELETFKSNSIKEFKSINEFLQDFMNANNIDCEGDDQNLDINEMTKQIIHKLNIVFSAYEKKSEDVHHLYHKLSHMANVNGVIGEKISQYAEKMIQEKKEKPSLLKKIFNK